MLCAKLVSIKSTCNFCSVLTDCTWKRFDIFCWCHSAKYSLSMVCTGWHEVDRWQIITRETWLKGVKNFTILRCCHFWMDTKLWIYNTNNTMAHLEMRPRIFRFWNFFSPVFLGWWGHVFGSEIFEKFWPHMGFPPELFFQKSSIFSNISYRGVSWSDCLPRGVYI